MKVSILMLTYNAPRYVLESIMGVNKLKKKTKNLELIVLDNDSGFTTKLLLKVLKAIGWVDKLVLNPQNDFFAKGNNIASTYSDKDSTHYLLLNSDIKVIDSNCLNELIKIHPEDGGISSFGACLTDPIRADGYCMLIDKFLYDKYKLDEHFEWWWSVTKLQSQLLAEGYKIRAVNNHEEFIHHYGGKSGDAWKNAKGMKTKKKVILDWFNEKKENVEIIDKL